MRLSKRWSVIRWSFVLVKILAYRVVLAAHLRSHWAWKRNFQIVFSIHRFPSLAFSARQWARQSWGCVLSPTFNTAIFFSWRWIKLPTIPLNFVICLEELSRFQPSFVLQSGQ